MYDDVEDHDNDIIEQYIEVDDVIAALIGFAVSWIHRVETVYHSSVCLLW